LGDRDVWDGDHYFHLKGAPYFLNEHRGAGEFNVEWWPALFVRAIPVGQELLCARMMRQLRNWLPFRVLSLLLKVSDVCAVSRATVRYRR
jgi:hypothetical protein